MNNIKRIREEKGMTQKALADAASISAPYLLDLERGSRGAKPETWMRIASALGCTVAELMNDDGGNKDDEGNLAS